MVLRFDLDQSLYFGQTTHKCVSTPHPYGIVKNGTNEKKPRLDSLCKTNMDFTDKRYT